MANYKKALENGNFDQARKATELATKLRELVEFQAFEDTKRLADEARLQVLNIFKPVNYNYDPKSATVRLHNSVVSLTEVENKFFRLLTQNETSFNDIKLIQRHHIKQFVWPNREVTNNAVRILVQRLRKKIEANPAAPELLLNFNRKGYVFLGKTE